MIKSHHFSAVLPVTQIVISWQKTDFIEVLKKAANTAGLTVVRELAFVNYLLHFNHKEYQQLFYCQNLI